MKIITLLLAASLLPAVVAQAKPSKNALLYSVAVPTSNNRVILEEEPEPERELRCIREPGKRFCYQLRLLRDHLRECLGNDCLVLWRKQIRIVNELARFYNSLIIDDFETAHPLIGKMAKQTSRNICNTKVIGPRGIIRQLVGAYNRALAVLLDAQEKAGIERTITCRVTSFQN